MNKEEALRIAKAIVYCEGVSLGECMEYNYGCESCPGKYSSVEMVEAMKWFAEHIKEN